MTSPLILTTAERAFLAKPLRKAYAICTFILFVLTVGLLLAFTSAPFVGIAVMIVALGGAAISLRTVSTHGLLANPQPRTTLPKGLWVRARELERREDATCRFLQGLITLRFGAEIARSFTLIEARAILAASFSPNTSSVMIRAYAPPDAPVPAGYTYARPYSLQLEPAEVEGLRHAVLGKTARFTHEDTTVAVAFSMPPAASTGHNLLLLTSATQAALDAAAPTDQPLTFALRALSWSLGGVERALYGASAPAPKAPVAAQA